MKEKTRFDLEQEILDCWRVTDDIDIVLAMIDKDSSTDELMNVLIGLKTLYEHKFERTFDTFEQCVKRREFKSDSF